MDYSFFDPLIDCARSPFQCVQRPIQSFVSLGDRLNWLYLLTAMVAAGFVYIRAEKRENRTLNKFFHWLFPKKIYLHPSTYADVCFFWINRMLFPLLFASYLTLSAPLADQIYKTLYPYTERFALKESNGLGLSLFFSVYIVVAMDFGLYIAHYIMHKVPFLWEFHKVHHSAEVMTPITVYRVHPVDDIFTLTCGMLMTGFFAGVFQAFLPKSGTFITVDQVNVVFYVFYLVAYNLRHSHVWLSYGPFWSKVFISPAQHQIHHSDSAKHFDKNFGLILAVWDWLASTIYIPKEQEEISFGIGPESARYRTVRAMYFRPFIQASKIGVRRIKRRLGLKQSGKPTSISPSEAQLATNGDKPSSVTHASSSPPQSPNS